MVCLQIRKLRYVHIRSMCVHMYISRHRAYSSCVCKSTHNKYFCSGFCEIITVSCIGHKLRDVCEVLPSGQEGAL